MNWEITSAADGFAIAMLVMILLSLSVIGLLVFCIKRNGARRDFEVEDLLDEVANQEKSSSPAKPKAAATDPPKPTDPWERDPDWWKK